MQKEAYKPVWHSQPQLSVSAGSPHLLGCGHVWAWPPELLAPSQPWWAPPYTHSCPARVSAIYDGCPQSSKPSEWTLTKTKNGSEYLVYVFYFKFSNHNKYLRGSMLSLRTSACARRLSKTLWRLITAVSMSSCIADVFV